jgi:hypothetical protein
MGVSGQHHTPAALSRERDPVPILQGAGWAPGQVWTVAENLAPHRESIPGLSSPQPASRYAEYAISIPKKRLYKSKTYLWILIGTGRYVMWLCTELHVHTL